MNLGTAQIRAGLAKLGVPPDKIDAAAPTSAPAVAASRTGPTDRMNKTERRRADELEALKRAGEIRDWKFEALTLFLAPRCRYTPDFLIIEADGRIRFEETKGYWRDDARVKIKAAAQLYPHFPFTALRPSKGGPGWTIEHFRAFV